MCNFIFIEECLFEVYGCIMELEDSKVVIFKYEDLLEFFDWVYGCQEIVWMDYFIFGCLFDVCYIWKVLKYVLFG